MLKYLSVILLSVLVSCGNNDTGEKVGVEYNLIRPSAGIYEVFEKGVSKEKVNGNYFEKNEFRNGKLVKIERYDKSGKLTEDLGVPAVTAFEYDGNGRVKFVRYFDKSEKAAETPKFHYSVIEYVYDSGGNVILEIYRDKNFDLLKVPKDESGKIKNTNFISPVLAYVYNGNKLTIKAFDEKFNLIKETTGKKPCIPFIDCGEQKPEK